MISKNPNGGLFASKKVCILGDTRTLFCIPLYPHRCPFLYPRGTLGRSGNEKTSRNARFLVPPRGIEPPTYGLGNRRSIH